jgi:CDP-diacylglycerol--glycerol-3-phosphate 3-phosphatidyltransferase
MPEIVFLSDRNRERYLKIIAPVGNVFARYGVNPNLLSVTGLVLSMVAGVLYSNGSFFLAACVVVLAGACDTLDGQIARQTNRRTSFGAFFDSTLDRYSDTFLFIGLAYYFAGGQVLFRTHSSHVSMDPSPWTVVLIILAITGSYMVSYTRARAESLGVECKVGLMQRPERVVLLIIGSLLGSIPGVGPTLLQCSILILALSSNITAMHRILHVRNRILREAETK